MAYAAITYVVWGSHLYHDGHSFLVDDSGIYRRRKRARKNLTTMARSCSGVGSALVTIITMKCVYMLGQGNERTGFRWFALIVAVLFVLFITITCLTIREKSTVHMETPTVRQMFSALIHNDQAMTVVITIVLINCSLYITSNLLLYFFKYDVSGGELV